MQGPTKTEAIQALVVDDDESIRFFLSSTLQRMGYEVTAAANGEDALELLRNQSFELAVLDLELGGRIDGLRVLEAIRWRWPDMAAIILTGHATLESALVAIQEGIDGYLLKPARAEEVRQAVQEALQRRKRRTQQPAAEEGPNHLRRGPFFVDLKKRLVTRDGTLLELTGCEFDLLVHLIRNAQRVVPPPELVQVTQHYECETLNEARDLVKWYIHRLRRKVEPNPSRPRYILNVRGSGYTFKE